MRTRTPLILCTLLIAPMALQAVVRTDEGGAGLPGAGGAFTGQAPTAAGAPAPGGAPGVAAQASASGAGSGGGGGSGKSPGGTIGGNIKAVNAILNPEGKDKAGQSSKTSFSEPDPMTAEDTRDFILFKSLNSYSGYCACPYSRNVDGFECGVEAAYYKPGGFRIKCYPQDLRGQEYIFYRKNN